MDDERDKMTQEEWEDNIEALHRHLKQVEDRFWARQQAKLIRKSKNLRTAAQIGG